MIKDVTRCNCGVPEAIAGLFVWTEDGRIESSCGDGFLLVPATLVNNLNDMGAGEKADGALRESYKRILYDNLTDAGRWLIRFPFFRGKWIYSNIEEYPGLMGHGKVTTVEYRYMKGLVLNVANPVNILVTTEMLAGEFELFEGREPEIEIKENGETEVRMQRNGRRKKRSIKNLELPESGMGPYCAECGVPEEVGRRFLWDYRMGLITDRYTGTRMAFVPMSWVSVISSLNEEEERRDPVYTAAHEVFLKTAIRDPEADSLLLTLKDLWVCGLGRVDGVTNWEQGIEVEASGVCADSVSAGKLVSACEKVTGDIAREVEWKREGNRVKMHVMVNKEQLERVLGADWPG